MYQSSLSQPGFAQPNQESLLVIPLGTKELCYCMSGPVNNGEGHTTAVDGTCLTCIGIKLRNVHVTTARTSFLIADIRLMASVEVTLSLVALILTHSLSTSGPTMDMTTHCRGAT